VREYDAKEQDQPGAAGHFRDWLVEHMDEIESIHLERGFWVATDHKVEVWLDEMWGIYLEEFFPGEEIK